MVMRGERANAYNMPSILCYSYTCKSLDVVWLCPSYRDLLLMNLSLLNESVCLSYGSSIIVPLRSMNNIYMAFFVFTGASLMYQMCMLLNFHLLLCVHLFFFPCLDASVKKIAYEDGKDIDIRPDKECEYEYDGLYYYEI